MAMSPSSTISSAMTSPITPDRPKVGVGVFVVRPRSNGSSVRSSALAASDLEFIIGLRRGSHGANTWALPGGHLELNESFETCAAREVLEETGLKVTNIRFLTATNDIMFAEGKHYITIAVVCEIDECDRGREPEICEPNKCAAWEWVQWDEVVAWVEQGHNQGDAETNDAEARAKAGKKMFLPIVNLVKQRPGVMPLLY